MTSPSKAEECTASMRSLTPLPDDIERYKDTYNGFSKIAQKHLIYEKVTQHFDADVINQLVGTSPSEKRLKILGVGVGEGRHELHFLKTLSSHFKSIHLVAVDPNQIMLDIFRDKIDNLESSAIITCDWFPGTFADFVESSSANMEFDLITAIHSLYYTGDITNTVERMLSMLIEGGLILAEVMADENALAIEFTQKPWLIEKCAYVPKLSGVIRAIADRKGCNVSALRVPISYDCTEIFDVSSEFGNKILDFLAMTAHFRTTAPVHLVEDVLSFWRTHTVLDNDGRLMACGDDNFLVIAKPSPQKSK